MGIETTNPLAKVIEYLIWSCIVHEEYGSCSQLKRRTLPLLFHEDNEAFEDNLRF